MIHDDNISFDKSKATEVSQAVVHRQLQWQDTRKNMPKYEGIVELIDIRDNNLKLREYDIDRRVIVNDCDPLIAVIAANKSKLRPLLVTTACHTNKGGGVQHGVDTQEAEICRRTNYWDALRKIGNNVYPLQPMTFIYAKEVTVFKTPKYASTVDVKFDMMSVVIPKRPSSITQDGDEMYERANDRDHTMKCLSHIFARAARENYDCVIFNELGLGVEKHPTDEFIALLRGAISVCGIPTIFILAPKGNVVGENKEERRIWKKYGELLSTMEEHSDCDSPIDEAPERRQQIDEPLMDSDIEIDGDADIEAFRDGINLDDD